MALNVNFLKKIEDNINNLKISNNNSGILNNPYVFCQENSAIRSLNSKQTYERKSKVFKPRKIWNWPKLPNNFETKNLASHLLSTISIYIATHSLPLTKVIIEKSRGGRFLWNRNWCLVWIWAGWHYWKKTHLGQLWATFNNGFFKSWS